MRGWLITWQYTVWIVLVLLAAPAFAVDRYIDNSPPGGCSNGNTTYSPGGTGSCGSGSATLYTSISNALAAETTQAGDALYIRAGTYAEGVDSNAHTIPTGTTWENAPIISGYQNEVVTLRTGGGANIINLVDQSYIQYLKFANLVLDGVGSSMDNVVCIGTGVQKVHHISFENVEVMNGPHIGVFFHGHFNIFRGGSVHDIGDPAVFPPPFEYYGFYVEGDDNLVEYTEVYNTRSYGIHNHSSHPTGGTRNEYRYLLLHDTATNAPSQGAIVLGAGIDSFIHDSVIYDSAAHGIVVYSIFSEGTWVYNNTVYNSVGTGIKIQDNAPSPRIANNILHNNSTHIENGGVSTTFQTNLCTTSGTGCGLTGNPLFTNAAANDFSLLAGSPAINAGTAVSGQVCNGTCDIGAFETWTHAGCVVQDATPNTINITFTNNANPPILPASGITGFSATENGGAKTLSGNGTRVGDNQINLVASSNFSSGTTVRYSYSGGNATDSELIGGTFSQPLLSITNQLCTNNVSQGQTFTLAQTEFNFYGYPGGTEAGMSKKPHSAVAANTHATVAVGHHIWVRAEISCTGGECPSTGMFWRYSRNGGAYTVVPDTFGADNIKFCGTAFHSDVPSGDTTERLSADGLTFVPGLLVRSSNAIPTVSLAQNQKTEIAACLQFDTDIVPTASGPTYDFQLWKQDGTQINTYTQTPRVQVVPIAGGGGF